MRAQLIVGSLAGLLMAGSVNAAMVWDTGDPLSQGYEQFSPPLSGYTVDSPSAGLLTQNTTGENTSRYGLASANASTELVNASGWFIEWRVNSTSTGDFGVGLYANDSAGGIQLGINSTGWVSWNGNVTGSYAAGYHTFRVTRSAGGSDFQFQVDGGSPTNLSQYVPWGGASAMQFGDVSSANTGVAEWDYVAINGPVPEPTSLALLGLAGALTLRRRS